MTSFPTSKIELHQWVNSILLLVVCFFARETYNTIKADHELLASHTTDISVTKSEVSQIKTNVNFLTGRVNAISEHNGK